MMGIKYFNCQTEDLDTCFERGGHLVGIGGKLLWWSCALVVSAFLFSEVPEVYLKVHLEKNALSEIWFTMVRLAVLLGILAAIVYNCGMAMRDRVRRERKKEK